MTIITKQQIIGKTELIEIPVVNMQNIPAKIDTGAFRCSVWASDIIKTDKGISFKLFDINSPYYNGLEIFAKDYTKVRVRNSFGHEERRYCVVLKIKVGDKMYRADFTLANRSINKYPVLLGRNLLKNRFVVDVTKTNVHLLPARAKLTKEA